MKYLILLISFSVLASDDFPHKVPKTSVVVQSDGIALSMAMSAPQYDLNVTDLQIGLGAGYYEESVGFAIGFGKRFCFTDKSCGVMNFTGGLNESCQGLNLGITLKL